MRNGENMEPRLIILEDGTPFVTDGVIGGSKFIVKKQPSKEAIKLLHEFFIKNILKEEEHETINQN